MKIIGFCLLWLGVLLVPRAAQDTLASRIAHTDPAKYRHSKRIHGGAEGGLNYMTLFRNKTLETNLIFLHRGVLPPGGGIGHHFHYQMEEMFVIFDYLG